MVAVLHERDMIPADLTDDRATLAALLRDTIAAGCFPLSARVRSLD